MDIYILMGQSNMAGRGKVTNNDKTLGNPNVKALNQNLQWVEAHHPLHFDKPNIAAVGPGLSFGLMMAQHYPQTQIGLVPTAVGGTSIDSWTPGAQDKATGKFPYDDAVKRIKEAMKYGEIKGVIWHQGEADSDPEKADLYLAKIKVLINRIRSLVGNDQLPFVVGELGPFREKFKNFNIILNKLPGEVPFTAVASSEGLEHKGDHTHFDSPSANTLGERFAQKMIELSHSK